VARDLPRGARPREEAGDPRLLFPCYDDVVTLFLDIGDDAGTEESMAKAQQVCERAGVEPDSLVALPFLGNASRRPIA